jgi:aspartyl-tRNA(Asn)/glutamyl-tRNA(Gln) amidotransferase subunit A
MPARVWLLSTSIMGLNAVLVRMEKLEPVLHAFCTPTLEIANETAKQIEKDIMAGKEVGPLGDIPVGIKDLVCTAGIRTVSGSIAYENFVPEKARPWKDRLPPILKEDGLTIVIPPG